MVEDTHQELRQAISKNLRERMKVSKMDVAELAYASGVSPAMIYVILNCSSAATADKLSALASALQIPVSVLVS